MGSGVGYSKFYLFHFMLVLFSISFAYVSVSRGKQSILMLPKSGFLYFLYIMFFWYALSVFWSIEPVYSLKYLFYLVIGITLVFLLNSFIYNEFNYQLVFKVLSIFFILAIGIALLESFTSFRLPTSPYSEYATLFGRTVTDFMSFDSSIQTLIQSAPTSFWGNPNNLAVAMTLIFPFFAMRKDKVIKVAGIISIVTIIIMTGSRGAFLGLIFSILILIFLKGVRFWLPTLILMVFSFSIFTANIERLKKSDNVRVAELAWTGDALYSYLFNKDESMSSIGYRQQLIQNGLDALRDSGGLGVGGGGSQAVQEKLGGVANNLSSMHNFWIEVLVDAGVIFFIFFMAWYLTLTFKLYKIFKCSNSCFYQYQTGSLFVSMSSFLVSAVSASSVIYLLPFWLMLGMAIVITNLYKYRINFESSITSGC
jgi:teichuronic acid biosynthesis protein TuaE